MITLLLGYIYGVGFGLTVVGGIIYLMVMKGLKYHPSKPKILLGLLLWPIAWCTLGYKLMKIFRQEFSEK